MTKMANTPFMVINEIRPQRRMNKYNRLHAHMYYIRMIDHVVCKTIDFNN